MTAVTVALPAELEARAGAPDTDRTQWLFERAHGVTATQIRDLHLKRHGLPGTSFADLIKEKLALLLAATPEDREAAAASTFVGNQYTRWGNKREPIIAEQLLVTHGMQPESRVFRSAANPRYLASPDGVRVREDGKLETAEIKTSKDDVAPTRAAYRKKGYGIQQVWTMGVLGAVRSLYAWERHDSDWQDRGDTFLEPESLTPFGAPTAWVDFDEALFAELTVLADDFLEQLDAALAAARAGEEAFVDEELDTHAVNYLRGLDEEKQGKALKQSEWDWMLDRLTTDQEFVQETPLARVSFSPEIVEEKPTYVTDVERAKAANPELYARLERAQDDASQAAAALDVEARAVMAHETAFIEQVATERVVVKKAALRVVAAKGTKGTK